VSPADPLAAIVRELERCAIPFMLAGSFASTYHGEPRTTHDIDIVIDPSERTLGELVRALSPESFYVSEQAVAEAWRRRGQFNVVHMPSGWKVDLILRKSRPFSREEFSRRERAEIAGTPVYIASAEDTIVAKLEWALAGESERQLRDVVSILDMRGGEIDRSYVARWVEELGLQALWEQAVRLSEE